MRLALAAALVVALAPLPAHAWCRMTTSTHVASPGECITEGVPLAWKKQCSSYRFFNFPEEMTADEVKSAAALSFAQWNGITCTGGRMPMLVVNEGPEMSLCDRAEYQTGGSNIGTIVFVTSDMPSGSWTRRGYDPAAYAVTTVWHNARTGEILDVDMEINEARGPYTNCPDAGCPDSSHVDLRNVMTHEAGHWFGMAHSADPTATMYYAAPAGETSKRTLEADDARGFCAAYVHAVFPPGSCDDTPHGGLRLDCACTQAMPNCRAGCCAVAEREHEGADALGSGVLASGVLGFVAWRRRRGARA